MITEKRVLLVVSDERVLVLLNRFEAIEEMKQHISEEGIKQIWRYNKTPVVSKKIIAASASEVFKEKVPVLEVPEIKGSTEFFVKEFTSWAHRNGFECGEYITGKKIDTREEPCVLCSIANHKGLSPQTFVYNQVVKSEVDCIIYESPRFYVTSELGALKPGYLMVVPKEHTFLSIAQMPEMYRPEYMEVCRDVEYILKGAFGQNKPVVFFEHGSGPSGFSSHKKSIVHAHTHVLIGFELGKKYLDMIQMKRLDDLAKARGTHYFAYKRGADGKLLCCYDDRVYVQRQFPRQVLAKELGLTPSQYNWRHFEFDENVHTSLYYIHRFLSNSDQISERIKERTSAFVQGYRLRDDFET